MNPERGSDESVFSFACGGDEDCYRREEYSQKCSMDWMFYSNADWAGDMSNYYREQVESGKWYQERTLWTGFKV